MGPRIVALVAIIAIQPAVLPAQDAGESEVLAVVEAALDRISDEDWVGFTDLMLEEANAFTVYERNGVRSYRVRTWAESRADSDDADLVERGFSPTVHLQGGLASVWLPYDFYIDGVWSHCGVDSFTLLHTADGWRIASIAWTVEQPPDCEKHPDGPPAS